MCWCRTRLCSLKWIQKHSKRHGWRWRPNSNLTGHTVKGSLVGHIGKDISIRFPVTLRAGERHKVTITPDDVRRLHVVEPAAMVGNNMGKTRDVWFVFTFEIGTELCDNNISFGIQVGGLSHTRRLSRIYAQRAKSAYSWCWLDRWHLHPWHARTLPPSDRDGEGYASQYHPSGKYNNTDDLFNLCDRNGILMFAGWSCQWEWAEYAGGKWRINMAV